MKLNFIFPKSMVFGLLVFDSTVLFVKKHTIIEIVFMGKIKVPFLFIVLHIFLWK